MLTYVFLVAVEELLRTDGSVISSTGGSRGDDRSSLSSWSGLSKDPTSGGASPDDDDTEASSSVLAQENADLLQRLAQQQQTSWQLEEKVRCLQLYRDEVC